jgi:signal transduction histidine kinase
MDEPISSAQRLGLLDHELRSPVAALVAITEVLRAPDDPVAAADRQRLLRLGIEAGRSIERLLADPELFSVRLEAVDVAGLLAPVPPRVAVEAEPGLVVEGDPVRLRQALANLLANALRHGGPVTVGATREGSDVRIAVTDDGPGVPEGLDLFALGTSGSGSTGYGLFVVRAVAEAHGGHIELESSPGAGATFTLVLPSASGRG